MYYSLDVTPEIKCVVLDPYDVAILGRPEDSPKFIQAQTLLKKRNPNDTLRQGVDWMRGLNGLNKRFLPYNGAMSKEQLVWLEQEIVDAKGKSQNVLVFCHLPLCPLSSASQCLMWNYQEVQGLFNKVEMYCFF